VIEILTIGDELISGRTADINAAMIARALHAAGCIVRRVTTVGDAPEDIRLALLTCMQGIRFVIVTGGLGPTEDDRTAVAAADAFNDTLTLHPHALALLRAELSRRGLELNAPRQKQAMLPSTCTPIANPVGTACGFVMRYADRHYLFLPGVPAEACAMMEQFVTGYVNEQAGLRNAMLSVTLRVFGMRESVIQEALDAGPVLPMDVALGFYPHFPEVALRLTGCGPDEALVRDHLEQARVVIEECIGSCIYAEGEVSLPACVGSLLRERGSSVAVAESCTGGLLSHLITGVAGSSGWFERGIVAYSNTAKTQLAGVEKGLIEEHGAVSTAVAQALAQGIRTRAASTYGIGITGIAGPDGGTPEKPVGTVCFAVVGPESCSVHQRCFTGTRDQIKTLSAFTALDLLRRMLLGLQDVETGPSVPL
jgi:nicotinamide-nucleotide amidase